MRGKRRGHSRRSARDSSPPKFFEKFEDGTDAIAALLREPFHLLLLDMCLPEVDGVQTLRRRARPARRGSRRRSS